MTMPALRSTLAATLLFLAGCQLPAPAAAPPPPDARGTVAAALDSIFDDAAFEPATWGVLVRSLGTGETLYARNAGQMLLPASNVKAVTGAAALHVLGGGYRYRTPVLADGDVRDGVLHGDLVVVGRGDPTVSARFAGDARHVFRAWADSLRAHGVRHVTGDLVGNDAAFPDAPLGRGWTWDDLRWYYSAPFGALQLDDGIVRLSVAPGARVGEPAVVALAPAAAPMPVRNLARTGAAGTAPSVRIALAQHAPGFVVTGSIPADAPVHRDSASVQDPAEYFLFVLGATLADAGIRVDGGVRRDTAVVALFAPRRELFAHTSPPMGEIVTAFMKPSQNQIAEMLLRTVALEARGTGTGAAGRAVVDSLSAIWGLEPRLVSVADGSGLSRYNLIAPAYLVALLEAMDRHPERERFIASLPVMGVDGTLASRMRGTPAEGNVRAKTGTLTGTRALSGYLTTAGGERLVFSMIVNNHILSAADADRLVHAALLRLIDLPASRVPAAF
jgi:serine-type D-Ala-D-Ala carboxypeptidase/endopeptidase (penicillin-binding protein 4)